MKHTDPELFDGEIRDVTPEELAALEGDLSLLEDGADASHPPFSNTGGKLGQLVDTTCKSTICQADIAATCRVSGSKRRSRAKETGVAVQAWLDAAQFDWFQGVIPTGDGSGDCIVGGREEKAAIKEAHAFLSQLGLSPGKSTSGGVGYALAKPFVVGRTGTEKVASIASGSYTGGMPNLTITGGHGLCAVVAPLVQQRWPLFRITRADVCIDVKGRKAHNLWDELHDMSKKFAKSRGMEQPEVLGTDEGGRTFYLGDRKDGDVYLRVYEKGKQMNKSKDVVSGPDNWLRIEFVMRNVDGDLKAAFGQLSPGDMIRSKIWPRKWIAEAVKASGDSDRIEMVAPIRLGRGAREGDLRRTLSHGVYQYMGTFARIAEDEILQCREETGDQRRYMSRHDLIQKMGELWVRDCYAQFERLDAIIERYNLCVDTTLEDLAERAAVSMQAARIEDMRLKLAAKRSVAEAIRYGDEADVEQAVQEVRSAHEALLKASPSAEQEELFKASRQRGRRKTARRDYFKLKAARSVLKRSHALRRAAG